MTMCPGETTLSELLAGVLPQEQRSAVLAHVERCADCQRVLAAAREDSTSFQAELSAPAPLERGATLGRYVVLERIGAGAMGVVYAAYDPELDRQVALKVLRPESRQVEELRLRLVQEAQSLARLSHANVVSAFDVGQHGDCVFLAMELVEGVTLAEWLKTPRTWQEVLRVFTEVGRGLAAAHAAGLVHRDIKPANVLVGKDGRARVTDFGMARPLNRAPGATPRMGLELPASAVSPPVTPLTRTGALLGTPAYMAPELLTGRRADALSDQFSFCVALHEALYGVRPFEGGSLEEVARAALEGRVRPAPPGTKVPAWVRRAVLRGLKPRPEERYASMEPLLAALALPPRRLWVRVTALAGVASVVGAAVVWPLAYRTEARCEQEAQKLEGAWGQARREQVRVAFLATGAPAAAEVFEKVAGNLDAHASQWRTLRTEACVMSHEQPESTAWQTAACLDARLWQLAAVTDVLKKADAQTVRNAGQLTSSLEGLGVCRDAPELTSRPQPPDALRPRVDAARRKLADADARNAGGQYAEGLRLTTALIEDLQGLDYKPLEAEVLFAHGRLQSMDGKLKEAEATLYKAVFAAEAGRDDETVARAWNYLIWLVGVRLARGEDVERIVQHAQAAVDRLGRERFPAIAAEQHLRLTQVLLAQGKYVEAEAEITRGLEVARRAYAPDSLRMADFLGTLGMARFRLRKYPAALELQLQALALREHHLGKDHPDLIGGLNSLGSIHEVMGKADEAIAALRRAIALHEASELPEYTRSPLFANLATRLRNLGQLEEATALRKRALALVEQKHGRDHPESALALAALGELLADADHLEEALGLYREALVHLERSLGPDSPRIEPVLWYRSTAYIRMGRFEDARRDLLRLQAFAEARQGSGSGLEASVLWRLASVDLRTGAPRQALARCQRSLALHERVQGAGTMDTARDEGCLAEAWLLLGEPDKALPLVERARARLGTSSLEAMETAWYTFVLARTLRALNPPDRARAAAMAEEARSRFKALGVMARPELEQVVAWQRRAP
ncbi:protein kinase domain-containing protein [Pyxidicoccus xibeiensis]|uniref:serine/threonine-protein kinase n=1 Tax=Pyxidicoccus xibeiensis TaxID=2906759 RepID=UPI0020A77C14|nr:serine/threonine-protein kinase [Pyxidicoccus xibeiensis]MCP3135989.1 serine/threonine-protein kinase [Pyxidicoccus xibeiensis]